LRFPATKPVGGRFGRLVRSLQAKFAKNCPRSVSIFNAFNDPFGEISGVQEKPAGIFALLGPMHGIVGTLKIEVAALGAGEARPSSRKTNVKALRVVGTQDAPLHLAWFIYRLGRHWTHHKISPGCIVMCIIGRNHFIYKKNMSLPVSAPSAPLRWI
jgi:hypothetical protein